MDPCELSIVVPTCPGRTEKLRTLLTSVASTEEDRDRIEVVVVVDDPDDAPLEATSVLSDIPAQGLTQSHTGPAGARNRGLAHARGEWVLFFDDDARVDGQTIPGHLRRIRQSPDDPTANLGSVDWPAEQTASAWGRLLAESSMIFFRDQMLSGETYGYRHFCTSNLSVGRDWVRQVDGFNEGFPHAMHEDIELGWRLHRAFGLRVRFLPEIRSWHDHEMSPRGYFRREHRAGQVARMARDLNPAFHDEVWGWLGDPNDVLDVLARLFTRSCGQMKALLEKWSEEPGSSLSSDAIRAAYQAHVPLKRICFCRGYTGEDFDPFWDDLAPT